MPTATLHYDLGDPDDVQALARATASLDLALVLHDLLDNMRSRYKHGCGDCPKTLGSDAAYDLSEYIYRLLDGRDINLENLLS